jgi:quercetin dioxygenase-like cupin family protein
MGEMGIVRYIQKERMMPDTSSDIYFNDIKVKAVFAADGPKPQFLIDTPKFKALVVGLEAGQQIPLHPGEVAVYHFLEGTGLMTVGEETFAIKPGVTITAPDGAVRGMNAKTRVIFLGVRGE